MKNPAALPLLIWLTMTAETASAQEIEVRGRLQLEAYLERSGDQLEISGRLLDELGRPVRGEVRFSLDDVRHLPLPVDACGSARLPLPDTQEPDWLPTDTEGEFCARLAFNDESLEILGRAVHFEDSVLKASYSPTNIKPPRFVAHPNRIERRDTSEQVVEILARVSLEDSAKAGKLELSLNCEGARFELGSEKVVGSHLARFEFIPPAGLPVGGCEFEAKLSSGSATSRSARVFVAVQDSVDLEIVATSVHGDSARVEVGAAAIIEEPVGLVEASRDGRSMATVPLDGDGIARFDIELLDRETETSFSFLPTGPTLAPGSPALVELPPRSSWLDSWIPHVVGMILLVSWVVGRWIGSTRPRDRAGPEENRQRPSAVSHSRSTGPIRGKVVDLHTMAPVVGARASLTRARPAGISTVETVMTDDSGNFEFEHLAESSGALTVEFSRQGYMPLRTRVTAAEFSVTMATRRRSVADALQAWAQRWGPPWVGQPSTTAGHVASLARRRKLERVERWAAEVGRAAHGPDEPSEEDVRELDARAP